MKSETNRRKRKLKAILSTSDGINQDLQVYANRKSYLEAKKLFFKDFMSMITIYTFQ